MRTSIAIVTLACLSWSANVRANSFPIVQDAPKVVDPADTFEADCLGATEAPDCATRAALLESELVENLGVLEGLSDTDTVALFESAVSSGSAQLEDVGLRYFSRRGNVPADLWTSVKTFFFGPDSTTGQPSAELLAMSSDATDQRLSDKYLKLRSGSDLGGSLPSHAGAEDEWAAACVRDVELDEVGSFSEAERFQPATRLLMIDDVLPSGFGTDMTLVPVSGFVTDSSLADVEAFFTRVFGKAPYPPSAETETKLASLNAELVQLQGRLTSGDQQAIKRFQEVVDETTSLQAALTAGSRLGLDPEDTGDHKFWYDGDPSGGFTDPLPRAVVFGTDPLLKRTVIRYVNGGIGGTTPVQGTDGGTSQVPDGDVDAGLSPGTPTTKHKSDGCAVGPERDASQVVGWLAVASALVLRRRRRAR